MEYNIFNEKKFEDCIKLLLTSPILMICKFYALHVSLTVVHLHPGNNNHSILIPRISTAIHSTMLHHLIADLVVPLHPVNRHYSIPIPKLSSAFQSKMSPHPADLVVSWRQRQRIVRSSGTQTGNSTSQNSSAKEYRY